MPKDEDVEKVLDDLSGPRDVFRAAITNTDKLLADVMEFAEKLAKKRRVQPWSIVSEMTDHGSGVSQAIYELYRRKQSDERLNDDRIE